MITIFARNAHQALREGMILLTQVGAKMDSRAGATIVSPHPVTTTYARPTERVVFWNGRDANPFFHFMESLWMLNGQKDVATVARYASSIAQFSDNGRDFHAAYGHRWRNHFVREVGDTEFEPLDQLETIVELLQKNPKDRRCVLQMWSAEDDLGRDGADFPCNTHIYFRVRPEGHLDMTVCNRSNDIIWGAYGANVVQMSTLHEFVAAAIGAPVGFYHQVSNDWHAYEGVFAKHASVMVENYPDPYDQGEVKSYPLMANEDDWRSWLDELSIFMEEGPGPGRFQCRFFKRVAGPIWASWEAYKEGDGPRRVEKARELLRSCAATDWRRACDEWLQRRAR